MRFKGRCLPFAALQVAPVPNDPALTLERFGERVRAVRRVHPRVRLVIAPELHLMAEAGPLDAGVEPAPRAEEIPGPLTRALAEVAREHDMWLVPGSVYEQASEGVYNTAVVLSPDGELVASYRKCFPWLPFETTLPGTRAVVFDIPDVGRVGLAICHDGAFPELFRQLAWMGAEAVIQPVLTTSSDRAVEVVLARANAITNQIHVLSVNAAAPAGVGRSVLVDPEGNVRYQAGSSEEVITDVLDLGAVDRVREFGTFGLNRMWEQLDTACRLDLPVYGGRYQPRCNATTLEDQ
jgi:formamidase